MILTRRCSGRERPCCFCPCDHAGFYRVWAAGDYGHRSHIVLGADGLAAPEYVAFSHARNSCEVWPDTGRRFAIEVFVGAVVLRVCRFCAELAIQAATGATG